MKRIVALTAGLIAGLVPVTAAQATTAHSTRLPTLVLTMHANSLKVSGAKVSGAVNVLSRTREPSSSPQLAKLAPGVSYARALRAAIRHHGDLNYLRGLATLTFNPSHSRGNAIDQTVLTPGRWVAIDTVGQDPSQWPHQTFIVRRAKHGRRLPKAGGTVSTIEFGFRGPSTWHDGEWIRFENAGFLVHMIIGIKVANRTAAAAVTQDLKDNNQAGAQPLIEGFAAFVGSFSPSPAAVQQSRITAAPGTYVLTCFMDTQDGRGHNQLGMERTITIDAH